MEVFLSTLLNNFSVEFTVPAAHHGSAGCKGLSLKVTDAFITDA